MLYKSSTALVILAAIAFAATAHTAYGAGFGIKIVGPKATERAKAFKEVGEEFTIEVVNQEGKKAKIKNILEIYEKGAAGYLGFPGLHSCVEEYEEDEACDFKAKYEHEVPVGHEEVRAIAQTEPGGCPNMVTVTA